MSGQRASVNHLPALRCGQAAERTAVLLLTAITIGLVPGSVAAGPAGDSPGARGRDTQGNEASAVLIDFYEAFLRDQDLEGYRRQVASRYTEVALGRIAETGSTDGRRAAVLALWLMGTFERSNGTMAKALRDADPTVRALAESGLWAIWFRADKPENNESLEQVSTLTRHQRFDDALLLANDLIARSPRFAEAYNQRAIIYFALHRYEESAADCARVLELNPYHFGALGGLAMCQQNLDKRSDAIKTLRRALRLRPFVEGLRERIAALEAEGD